MNWSAYAEIVREPSALETVNRLVVRATNGAARVLPEAWMSWIMEKVSRMLDEGGSGLPYMG